MSFWIILSWVVVVILTAINIVVFLKLKRTSDQMLQMAFPGKSMKEALAQMQGMMGQFQKMGSGNINQAQLKAAMDQLKKMRS